METGVSAPPRPKVVWWGTHPPIDIAREVQHRHLQLAVSEDEDVILNTEVRALLLPHQSRKGVGALRARASRLRVPLGDRGGRLYVVAFGEAERQLAVAQLPKLTDVVVLDGTAASTVAEACARWDPGRSPGEVEIVLPKKCAISPQEELLLRRAFSDFTRLDVQPLSGGLSGNKVWRVRAMDRAARSPQPFLVKAGPLAEITEEIATTREFVLDHMPFTNRPPLLVDRCVSGFDCGLLVSMLVERSERFDDYLARGGSPEKVIPSIFGGPLRCWRDNTKEAELALAKVYEQRIRGHRDPNTGRHTKDGALEEAHRLALGADAKSPAPEAVIRRLAGYPRRVTKTCQAHGDLHPRNIFVRDNSDEIILIDFAKSGQMGNPHALDASNLDVALAFDGWRETRTTVSLDEIRRIYMPPLFDVQLVGPSSRAEAIRVLRRHSHHDCPDESEYTLAVVAGLLRTARLLAVSKGPEARRREFIAAALTSADVLAATLP
jgi:hypothetical protein